LVPPAWKEKGKKENGGRSKFGGGVIASSTYRTKKMEGEEGKKEQNLKRRKEVGGTADKRTNSLPKLDKGEGKRSKKTKKKTGNRRTGRRGEVATLFRGGLHRRGEERGD